MSIELVWEALDSLMEEINKPTPPQRAHRDTLGGIDHAKLDREKQKGEALGLARAIALLTGRTVDSVREEAVARYVGADAPAWGSGLAAE